MLLRTPPLKHGGAEGIRTHDILLAKQTLYQLSYGPDIPKDSSLGKEQRNMRRVGLACAPGGAGLIP